MPQSLALYSPSISSDVQKNPFGKDTANIGLFRALAEYGGFDNLFVLSANLLPHDVLKKALVPGNTSRTHLHGGRCHDFHLAARAGCLVRGKADLADLAWLRRPLGDRAYSLIGLVHTIAPPAVREYIAASSVAPVQPWDALICTSPAVRDALAEMFDKWCDYLVDRFRGRSFPRPQLPLIPLGVDASALAAQAERIDRREALRQRLGLGPDDILVLWLGRLSFFEKAFPQPMFRAIEEAASLSGKRLCFAMVGWFPNGELGRSLYEEAARAYAPSVPLFILDGNDQQQTGEIWAAADIFLSLVDNIQETFGLTPLEAMAAGLPIVASDWDGYRFTMRDGENAFLVRTLGASPGNSGRLMRTHHILGTESYQSYVGTVAQHTAVDVAQAAEYLARLALSPDLRRRMGQAGRERVRTQFDWPIVARQLRGLVDDLERERASAESFDLHSGTASNPVKGDPFADFSGFPNTVLSSTTRVTLRPGVTLRQAEADLQRCTSVRLDGFAAQWRIGHSECQALLRYIAKTGSCAVEDVQSRVPDGSREPVMLTLIWMCKLGVLAWE